MVKINDRLSSKSLRLAVSRKSLQINLRFSLKCMGNPIQDMIEIRHQEMEEVETDHYEKYGTISVGIEFDVAMACGVV